MGEPYLWRTANMSRRTCVVLNKCNPVLWLQIFFPHFICDSLYVYVYEQFLLQSAHPCFKIDHVWSSGKFSYMFIVYMEIAD